MSESYNKKDILDILSKLYNNPDYSCTKFLTTAK